MKTFKNIITLKLWLIAATLMFCFSNNSIAQIPQRPNPPRLVNDFAGILSSNQVANLEKRLVAFADTTSNQIAIIIVPQLYGYDKAQFAYKIGEQWGIGQKGVNNGLVILVKPKDENSKGEAHISTAYGLEGAVTDALAKRVIEKEMIPFFNDNDYYGGINAALEVLMPIISGEISVNSYGKSDDGGGVFGAIILFIIIIIVAIALSSNGNSQNYNGKNNRGGKKYSLLDALILGSILNGGGGSSNRGDFGGFGGGSSGGFGGFGGGSFGGGGAGGSW